jgi:hypothetical protein
MEYATVIATAHGRHGDTESPHTLGSENAMYERFRAMPVLAQIVAVMIALLAISVMLEILVGLIKALIPLAIVAVVIVALLTVFDKVRD